MINVQSVYPGASPLEIEQMITFKIEDNIDGITGIKRVTSKSLENTSSVLVEIENNANNQVVLQDIKNAIDRINSFPDDMESPSITLIENLNPAISFAISGNVTLDRLKLVSEQIEDDLKDMQGISKITVSGYPVQEMEISVRENDIKKYNVSFYEIHRAIQQENIDITGGTIKSKKKIFRLEVIIKNIRHQKFLKL